MITLNIGLLQQVIIGFPHMFRTFKLISQDHKILGLGMLIYVHNSAGKEHTITILAEKYAEIQSTNFTTMHYFDSNLYCADVHNYILLSFTKRIVVPMRSAFSLTSAPLGN